MLTYSPNEIIYCHKSQYNTPKSLVSNMASWANVESFAVPNVDAAMPSFVAASNQNDPKKEKIKNKLFVLGSAMASISAWIQIEILRDFWQIISLLFEGLKLPDEFTSFYGNVSYVFSACFSCMITEDVVRILSIVLYMIQVQKKHANKIVFHEQETRYLHFWPAKKFDQQKKVEDFGTIQNNVLS